MEAITFAVRVSGGQQTAIELELHTRFDLQADDVQETGRAGEKFLLFVVGPEWEEERYALLTGLLEQRRASGAILDFSCPPLSGGDSESGALSLVEEQLERAERVLARVRALAPARGEERLARVLGEEGPGVILAALEEYRERRMIRPLEQPLPWLEMAGAVCRNEYVSGVVAVDLGDLIGDDDNLERVLDHMALLLTSSDLLMDIEYEIVGQRGRSTLWLRVSGDASEIVGELPVYYEQALVVFTAREARAIRRASAFDPWMDQGVDEARGNGYVLAASLVDDPPEEFVFPPGIAGRRVPGLWIDDGALTEHLTPLQAVLGRRRTWRAWPNSDLALVVPAASFARPLDDPLLLQLIQAIPLQVEKEEEEERSRTG